MIYPAFGRYVGIDYSGAQTAESGLKGIRAFRAEGGDPPVEIWPTSGSSRYWSRKNLAGLLTELLQDTVPTLVGIDHSFSFPLPYFQLHELKADWDLFLDDFQQHWPTDAEHTSVEDIRRGSVGNGKARLGNSRWRRLCEVRAGAKSVFHFDVPGAVAKSTHAGLPWLRYLRAQLGARLHFWPFDGWEIPAGKSALAEAYPSLWKGDSPQEDRTPDQHDAYVVAAWLQHRDRDGSLHHFLRPSLLPQEYAIVQVEGWILGIS